MLNFNCVIWAATLVTLPLHATIITAKYREFLEVENQKFNFATLIFVLEVENSFLARKFGGIYPQKSWYTYTSLLKQASCHFFQFSFYLHSESIWRGRNPQKVD